MKDLDSMNPRARRAGLTAQTVGEEILIFDDANETAHALNAPAAFVWQHADGTRTIEQIARDMTRAFGTTADAHVVWYALEQLSKKNLLQENGRAPFGTQTMTRRQFLQRAAAGAIVLAVVTSIIAPTPAHAQSGCVAQGQTCNSSDECCPGLGCCTSLFPTCETIDICPR